MPTLVRTIALLRGINVGGNKKVPMADLKKMLATMGFANVVTLLNSGNAVFDAPKTDPATLAKKISAQLEKTFGFPVPVLIRTEAELAALRKTDPFKGINVKPETRLYVTFLSGKPKTSVKIPYVSPDGNYKILSKTGGEICSVLTITKDAGTVDAMAILEKEFGKDITTRNWNTVEKLANA